MLISIYACIITISDDDNNSNINNNNNTEYHNLLSRIKHFQSIFKPIMYRTMLNMSKHC